MCIRDRFWGHLENKGSNQKSTDTAFLGVKCYGGGGNILSYIWKTGNNDRRYSIPWHSKLPKNIPFDPDAESVSNQIPWLFYIQKQMFVKSFSLRLAACTSIQFLRTIFSVRKTRTDSLVFHKITVTIRWCCPFETPQFFNLESNKFHEIKRLQNLLHSCTSLEKYWMLFPFDERLVYGFSNRKWFLY